MIKKNIYLLLGPEEGEKRQFIKNHIIKISEKIGEKPEILKFYAFESNMIDIVSILQNESLFSKYTVLVLYNVEEIKGMEELKILQEYLEHPSQTATLFLLSDNTSLAGKKIPEKIPEENKRIFWELTETRKQSWIHGFFRQQNIKIEQPALEFLLEMVENNTHNLKSICMRLALFFGQDSVIRDEDLEKYVYHSKEENVFTLFERIAGRDFPASMEILHKILLSGESDGIMLVNGLLWQIRKLLDFKRLIKRNFHKEEIYRKLKIWSKKNQYIYSSAHKNYTLDEVISVVVLISDLDTGLRRMKADLHTVLLQLLIYYIIKRGGTRIKGEEIIEK
ncbi:MAG: DNA polymerase III subunit delta [Spirochaetales bacterium]|nr:DNA polymerase III subunit delta [Spirochaetales bacterium]